MIQDSLLTALFLKLLFDSGSYTSWFNPGKVYLSTYVEIGKPYDFPGELWKEFIVFLKVLLECQVNKPEDTGSPIRLGVEPADESISPE